jgi:hypothetical protein
MESILSFTGKTFETLGELWKSITSTYTGEESEWRPDESQISDFKFRLMPATAPSREDAVSVWEILQAKVIPRCVAKQGVEWERTFRSDWQKCRDKTSQVKMSLVESYATLTFGRAVFHRWLDIESIISRPENHDEACNSIVSIFKNEELKKKYGLPRDLQHTYDLKWAPDVELI